MKRIQQISQFLLVIFNILLVGIPITTALIWMFIETHTVKDLVVQGLLFKPISTPEGMVNLAHVQWTALSKLVAVIGDIVGLLPSFLSLFSLKIIFAHYKKGEIFTILNAKHYRRLGLLFFLNALIAKPLHEMLMILATTLSNPPGHRYISLSFGTHNIESLFYGLIVIVISWVMLEASRMDEEQRLTV